MRSSIHADSAVLDADLVTEVVAHISLPSIVSSPPLFAFWAADASAATKAPPSVF
jgi:hypothetical protein